MALGPREVAEDSGRDPEAIEAQLQVLRRGGSSIRLERPATLGDGIRVLPEDDWEALEARHQVAARSGRLLSFVPASGAATRMVAALQALREQAGELDLPTLRRRVEAGEEALRAPVELLEQVRELALWDELKGVLVARGADPYKVAAQGGRLLLDGLLDRFGLRLAELPKGLVPFHRTPAGARTAFEEHLAEAAALVRDGSGVARLHFTVSPEHREAFERRLQQARQRLEPLLGARFEVRFSHQDPATDTVAVEDDGSPLRDGQGRLVFRPGGHGALLGNLQASGGEVVLVKNIDNVVPDPLRPPVVAWRKRLCGLLLRLESRQRAALSALEARAPGAVGEAGALLEALQGHAPSSPDALWERLYRPLRVCGMVRNTGDPGGGPYWVRDAEGRVSLQIVEAAQVDRSDPEQDGIFQQATHFNPVDMVLALRDHHDRPWELPRYVDGDAAIVTRKTWQGRPIRALEHPGLWNGGMAGWLTVFVEIPRELFNPVKTLGDLLGPGHRVDEA